MSAAGRHGSTRPATASAVRLDDRDPRCYSYRPCLTAAVADRRRLHARRARRGPSDGAASSMLPADGFPISCWWGLAAADRRASLARGRPVAVARAGPARATCSATSRSGVARLRSRRRWRRTSIGLADACGPAERSALRSAHDCGRPRRLVELATRRSRPTSSALVGAERAASGRSVGAYMRSHPTPDDARASMSGLFQLPWLPEAVLRRSGDFQALRAGAARPRAGVGTFSPRTIWQRYERAWRGARAPSPAHAELVPRPAPAADACADARASRAPTLADLGRCGTASWSVGLGRARASPSARPAALVWARAAPPHWVHLEEAEAVNRGHRRRSWRDLFRRLSAAAPPTSGVILQRRDAVARSCAAPGSGSRGR